MKKPTEDRRKEIKREEMKRDREGFKEKYGIPDDPKKPLPPSGDRKHRRDN